MVGPGMFDGLAKLLKGLFVISLIFVPLGLWKLIEIIIWICGHFHISIN